MRKSEMRYSELKVEIVEGEDGGWRIRMQDLGGESTSEPLKLPFAPGEAMKALHDLLFQIQLDDVDEKQQEQNKRTLEKRLESRGHELYTSLFGRENHRILQERLKAVRSQFDRGLRVQISWDPRNGKLNQIGGLPWEIMISDGERFGLSRDLVLSRFLDVARPVPPCSSRELRILMVASQPKGSCPVYARDQLKAIRLALRHDRHLYVATEAPIINKVRQRLIDGRFHVLHFLGHGYFDPEDGVGQILWENDRGGKDWLRALDFATQMAGFDSLRLVLLSTCYGGALPRNAQQDGFQAIAPALIRAGLPAVIGMQFPITHEAARLFSESFYRRLAAGEAVDTAATEARLSLLASSNRHEWILPSVFMQAQDGTIIQMKEPAGDHEILQVGISNFDDGYGNGMEVDVDRFLNLACFFGRDGRPIPGQEERWNDEIFPELELFLSQLYGHKRPLRLDFAALWSLVFAAGYCLEAKAGLDVEIFQRTQKGGFLMKAESHESDGPLLNFKECVFEGRGDEIAIAISITNPTLPQVETFLNEHQEIPIGRLFHAEIQPEPKSTSVRDGSHALQLAHDFKHHVARMLPVKEQRPLIHLFCSAPNVFSFYLGQQARVFGSLQLYEHPYGTRELGVYYPSIRFPKTLSL